MLKKQIHLFLTAVLFYTRIPCPAWVDHSEEYLNKATIYFPVIGWLAGATAAVAFMVCQPFFHTSIALAMSLIVGILLTGAFHEDGFADVCDGFGGGWAKMKILEIMKDSRVGAYGAIGLLAVLLLKYITLYQIVTKIESAIIPATTHFSFTFSFHLLFVFLIAHSLSRFVAVTLIYTHAYARENEDSKAKPVAKKLTISELSIAGMFALAPVFVYGYVQQTFLILWVLLPLGLLKWRLGAYFQKWIGGYTGDCLGATQQLSEIIVYLFFACSVWKFS